MFSALRVSRVPCPALVQLQALLASAKVDANSKIVTYCQLGVRAAFVAAVLKSAGFKDVAVYDASMKEYSRSYLPLNTSSP